MRGRQVISHARFCACGDRQSEIDRSLAHQPDSSRPITANALNLTTGAIQNDFALTRTFKLAGAQSMQFRWEVFNVINHVNFGTVPPGTTTAPLVTALNSASFGQIQTAGDPRIMQFALKFTF